MNEKSKTIWLQISSGRGPSECMLFVAKLTDHLINLSKYQRWKCEIIDTEPGDKPHTCRSSLLRISGNDLSILHGYEGTLQWIYQSPYRPRHQRKNWFIGVEQYAIEQSTSTQINPSELQYETYRASGSGGQNINKVETAVRVTYLPTGLQVSAQEERSQAMNKKLAYSKLVKQLEERSKQQYKSQQKQLWEQHNALERGNPKKVFYGEGLIEDR